MDRMTRARIALKLEQLDSKLKSFLANYQIGRASCRERV